MLFKVEKGEFAYGNRKIFENINISVESGQILSIMGPNGAGKTTFIKCLLGMLKWKNGRFTIDGRSIGEFDNFRDIWKIISYVPQKKASIGGYTVKDFVLLGRNPHISGFSMPSKSDFIRVEEVLNELGLSHMENLIMNRLSGGEIQMLYLARALVNDPKLLVLDEPESNLDVKNQIKLFKQVSKLTKEKDIACIINTHFLENAVRFSDYSLIIGSDLSSEFGETKDIVNEYSLKKYFGVLTEIFEVENKSRGKHRIISILDIEEGEIA